MRTPSASKNRDLNPEQGIDGLSLPRSPISAHELTQRVTEVNKPPRNLRGRGWVGGRSRAQLGPGSRDLKREFGGADPYRGAKSDRSE